MNRFIIYVMQLMFDAILKILKIQNDEFVDKMTMFKSTAFKFLKNYIS